MTKTDLNIEGFTDEEFSFDPTPTHNAMGGTELMMKWLKEMVKPELLEPFQIIPTRVRALEDKPRLLWMHDTADDPESRHLTDEASRRQFVQMVCVSNWQKDQFEMRLGIKPSFITVLRNAIYPINMDNFEKPDPKKKLKLIYHTTPHRGLALLVFAFMELVKKYPNIELDVYSSFKIYGWEQRDQEFADVFRVCKNHPNINYHGTVSNDEIREALKNAHIFAHPSIWPETSCISLMEAMSAQCYCIYPNFAALPETGAGFGLTYKYHEDQREHVKIFFTALETIIKAFSEDKIGKDYLFIQKVYSDTMYSWSNRKEEWEALLTYLIAKNMVV